MSTVKAFDLYFVESNEFMAPMAMVYVRQWTISKSDIGGSLRCIIPETLGIEEFEAQIDLLKDDLDSVSKKARRSFARAEQNKRKLRF